MAAEREAAKAIANASPNDISVVVAAGEFSKKKRGVTKILSLVLEYRR